MIYNRWCPSSTASCPEPSVEPFTRFAETCQVLDYLQSPGAEGWASRDELQRRSMRVLGWPAWCTRNPYICSLYQGVAERGVRVEQSPKAALHAKHEVIHLHWAEQIFWGASTPTASASYASKICADPPRLAGPRSSGLFTIFVRTRCKAASEQYGKLSRPVWRGSPTVSSP